MSVKTKSLSAVCIIIAAFCACSGNIPAETAANTASITTVTTTAATAPSSVSAEVTIENGKFTVNGSEIWFNGVNTPWDNWNDFGGDFDEAFWDSHFAELQKLGCNSSRVWVNCNGMSIVRLGTDGTVKSVNDKHWQDLDKLFEIAEKYQIYLMPTLLSFDHFKDSNTGYEAWRTLVSDDTATQSYIDNYVIPFVKRYGDNDYCFAVDLCNEPDWVYENAESGQIDMNILAEFFAKCSAAVHDNSDLLTTVGLAMTKYSSEKHEGNYYSDEKMTGYAGESAPLDFWSNHWYYWEKPWYGYPYNTSPEDFGLDPAKPALIGECSALGDADMTLAEQYKSSYDSGWAGIYAWTSNKIDDNGGLDECGPALSAMNEYIPEKIHPLTSAQS
ncbi:MAG: cellulase (glycosyl hydrolase family 5) [Ruminococcus sp.]|jgi:hypothetical protein|nr:cellulase (glycosyl hydrolase family 5) [Ruminococcus sp.]